MVTPPVILHLGPDRVPLEFRHVPAGSFLMGQRGEYAHEEPVHAVALHGFYLGTYPVTQQQFAAWTASPEYAAWLAQEGKVLNEVPHQNGPPGNPDHPAENMSWHAAVAFCLWIEKQRAHDLPPGFKPCLPTEAEWEYACRWRSDPAHPEGACTPQSCSRTEYYPGDSEAALAEVGWYDGNSGKRTDAVTEKPESHPLGLCCLHGNVWEWCADAWNEAAYCHRASGLSDPYHKARLAEMEEDVPGAKAEHPNRVVRGGSWFASARWCRSAIRGGWWPGFRNWVRGFRVALVPGFGGGGQEQESGATTSKAAPGDGGRGTRPESEGAVDPSTATLPKPPA